MGYIPPPPPNPLDPNDLTKAMNKTLRELFKKQKEREENEALAKIMCQPLRDRLKRHQMNLGPVGSPEFDKNNREQNPGFSGISSIPGFSGISLRPDISFRGPTGYCTKKDSTRYFGDQPRFEPLPSNPVLWNLPTGQKDTTWVIPESDDPLVWSEAIEQKDIPVVGVSYSTMPGFSAFAPLAKKLFNKASSALKRTGIFAGIGTIWLIFGFAIDRRIPGPVDEILTVTGLIFLLYALIKHGYSTVRWFTLSKTVEQTYDILGQSPSALLNAIEAAISYRKGLKPNQMGQDSDKELLDLKSYENLSNKENIPISDILRLSRSLKRETSGLNLIGLTQKYGLSLPAASVYRDLADINFSLENVSILGPEAVEKHSEVEVETEIKKKEDKQERVR